MALLRKSLEENLEEEELILKMKIRTMAYDDIFIKLVRREMNMLLWDSLAGRHNAIAYKTLCENMGNQ